MDKPTQPGAVTLENEGVKLDFTGVVIDRLAAYATGQEMPGFGGHYGGVERPYRKLTAEAKA